MSNNIINIRIDHILPWRCTPKPDWRKYAKAMRAGDVFPPVGVMRLSRNRYELLDGMHRARAAKAIGRKTIPAIVLDYGR